MQTELNINSMLSNVSYGLKSCSSLPFPILGPSVRVHLDDTYNWSRLKRERAKCVFACTQVHEMESATFVLVLFSK